MFYKFVSAASFVVFYVGAGILQSVVSRPNEFVGTALALMGLAIAIAAQLRCMRANAHEVLTRIALVQAVMLVLCYSAVSLTDSPRTAQARQNFTELAAVLLVSNMVIANLASALNRSAELSFSWEFFTAALLLHFAAMAVRSWQPFGPAAPILDDQYLAWHAACFFLAQLTFAL